MKKLASLLTLGLLAACAMKPSDSNVVYDAYPMKDPSSVRFPASETGTTVKRLDTAGYRFPVNIEQCAGTASLVQNGNEWLLRIRNADCANLNLYDRNGVKVQDTKLEGSGKGNRWADIRLVNNGSSNAIFKVEIESGSGKTRDIFYVTVRPKVDVLSNGQSARLDDCGGYVTVSKDNSGSVHVNFKNVQYCNMFDIVGDEDGVVKYPTKMFPSGSDSPSYTLPKKVMDDFGFKRVLIQVRSASGIIEDKFYVSFFNW